MISQDTLIRTVGSVCDLRVLHQRTIVLKHVISRNAVTRNLEGLSPEQNAVLLTHVSRPFASISMATDGYSRACLYVAPA